MTTTLRQSIEGIAVHVTSVAVPSWPGIAVYVRRLTIDEYDRFVGESAKLSEFGRVKLLALLSLCDADGVRAYGDTPEDLVAIGKLDPRALSVIAEASAKLNLVTDEAVESAKKNSEETA